MGRPILSASDIDQAIAAGQKQVVVPPDAIVTQLAREYAQEKDVALIDGRPEEGGQAIKPAGLPPAGEIALQHSRVKAAVIAELGAEPAGLDAAIARILEG